eukprot:scaffold59712_cov45-Phaeocystis_antarctica.AAC.1
MPVVTAVQYGPPLDVCVPVREVSLPVRLLAVCRGAAHAAEGGLARLAQADVEGDVRCVRMHIEAQVLAWLGMGLGLEIGLGLGSVVSERVRVRVQGPMSSPWRYWTMKV